MEKLERDFRKKQKRKGEKKIIKLWCVSKKGREFRNVTGSCREKDDRGAVEMVRNAGSGVGFSQY